MQVLPYGLSVQLVFVVTIALFPSVISQIHSVDNPLHDFDSYFTWIGNLFSPLVCFLLFNAADYVGRTLTIWFTYVSMWGGEGRGRGGEGKGRRGEGRGRGGKERGGEGKGRREGEGEGGGGRGGAGSCLCYPNLHMFHVLLMLAGMLRSGGYPKSFLYCYCPCIIVQWNQCCDNVAKFEFVIPLQYFSAVAYISVLKCRFK